MKILLLLNKVYFIKYKTRANYFITRLLHGIKCGQKLKQTTLHTQTKKFTSCCRLYQITESGKELGELSLPS